VHVSREEIENTDGKLAFSDMTDLYVSVIKSSSSLFLSYFLVMGSLWSILGDMIWIGLLTDDKLTSYKFKPKQVGYAS